MKNRSLFFIFIIVLVSLATLTACSEKDGSGYLFKYSLTDDPRNLDPQLATDDNAATVMANMYTGLLSASSDGNINNAVAIDYTISEDKLKYTFTLCQDNYWASSDSDFKRNVTAADFVFAFQRIFDKSTSSPYADEFMCIKNSSEVLNGELNKNQLGVYSDGDYKLIIELQDTNVDFLSLLTTTAAFPCNEEFFNQTKGKYGLDSDDIISNGPFYVKEWQYDPYGQNNYLILRKNRNYSQTDTIYPSSLNYFVQKLNDQIYSDFTSGVTDCVIADGTEKNSLSGKYSYNQYETSSYGLIFGSTSKHLNNSSLRQALGLSIDKTVYSEKLPSNLRSANAIIPAGITLLNKSYRELVAENSKAYYDLNNAQISWELGLKAQGVGSVDGVNILVSENFTQYNELKNITQQWQNKLNFFCGIEVVPDNEYNKRINSGDFDIALYEITTRINSPRDMLMNFHSQNNIFNYSNNQVDSLLSKSVHTSGLNESVQIFSNIESYIVTDYYYIPVFYKKEYLLYDKEITDIDYNPFTNQIYFKNAKNFD